MNSRTAYILLLSLSAVLLIWSCNKENGAPPHNPYSDVDYQTPVLPVDTLDPASFMWLQKHVFETRCAVPGCHDGHFEPDFRTLGSSFSTLVYHPIVKNNATEEFTFRVVPYDTAASVLHERLTNCCFVNTNDRMPQDAIGVPLEDSLIDAVEAWIMNGAPDMFGEVAPFPDKKPFVNYYVALSTDYQTSYSDKEDRIDSVVYNPFIITQGTEMVIAIQPIDDVTPMADLQVNKLLVSYDRNDFSPLAPGYKAYQATYFAFNDTGAWLVNINTADFAAGGVVYMRYYVNDGEHAQDTEMPKDGSIDPYKTFWSFYVAP